MVSGPDRAGYSPSGDDERELVAERPPRRARLTTVLVVVGLLLVGAGVAVTWPQPAPPIASAKVDPPAPVDPNAAAAPCEADDIDVELAADRQSVTPGVPVGFTLSLRNTGRVQCLVEGSRHSVAVTVLQGEADAPSAERVWSSADCADEGEERLLLLGPDDVDTTKVSWSDARSTPGCEPDRRKLAAGVYTAQITLSDVKGVSSNEVRLTYTVPEPSGKPSGSPSGEPSGKPTGKASDEPSTDPSADSSTKPSTKPSTAPSTDPSAEASADA